MTHYKTSNVKLSNSLLNKLKFGIKDGPEVILNISSNLIGNSNGKTNFPHFLKCFISTLKIFKNSIA